MKYNKSLHIQDYVDIAWSGRLFEALARRLPADSWICCHEHRKWEYGMALAAITLLDRVNVKTVLDVGAAGSLFPAMATQLGFEVTAIDPSPTIWCMETQNPLLLGHIDLRESAVADFSGGPFDAVVAISVVEHVEDDKAFLADLTRLAKKVVVLTTDFHGDGKPHTPNHLRAYNADMLWDLVFSQPGWGLTDSPAWSPGLSHVYDYSFASLCLVRK